ncbi:hypothetical protein ACY4TD_004424, partial [Escherichia coli]
DSAQASNNRHLRYFSNEQFALRNYCEFAISVRNTTVSIRQVVRTLNAQFCCAPDCVPVERTRYLGRPESGFGFQPATGAGLALLGF